jgi:signal transduction histidine kinase
MTAIVRRLSRAGGQLRRVLSEHGQVVDGALVIALAGGALGELATLKADRTVAVSGLAAVCCTAPVAWRRVRPVLAACASWAALVAYQVSSHDQNGAFVALAIVFVCYSVGRIASWPRLCGVAAWALLATTVIEIDVGFSLGADLAAWCLALAGLASGRLVTHWATTAQRFADVSAELAAEQESHEARVIAAERLRVARDLHDVVAHGLSAMVIQAGAARLVLSGDAPAAKGSLHSVASSGRAALADLRRVVGVRRRGRDPLSASPGLTDLDELAEQARAARLQVSISVAEQGSLAPDLEMTVFRLVQEALTNVRKHAPGATVAVVVSNQGDEVALQVRNGPPTEGVSPISSTGAGFGVVGMRERVAVYGGRLSAGPTSDGGFDITARLPLESAVPSAVTKLAPSGQLPAANGLPKVARIWSSSRTPFLIDLAIGAFWLAALEIQALSGDHLHVPRAAGSVLVALMAAASLGRRRFPFPFLLVVGALNLTLTSLANSHPQNADAVGIYTLAVATYSVAAYSKRRQAVLGLLVMLIGALVGASIAHQAAGYVLGAALMATAIWTAGRLVRRQRRLSQQLRSATAALLDEQEKSRALAVDAERSRIARDLHLLVATLATSMVIRAETACDAVTEDPAAAADLIAAIEADGRQAMAQMRQILGVLRHSDSEAPRRPVAGRERSLPDQAKGISPSILATRAT